MFVAFSRGLVRRYVDLRFEKSPIILGGCPRSGTTLLLSVLGSHSHIYSIENETATLYPRIRPLWLLKWLLLEDKFHLRHIPVGKLRFCEKTPGNLRHTEKIIDFFAGHVKIVNLFRDGRDVVTSRHPLNPTKYWVKIETWVNDVSYGLQVAANEHVHTLKYEDLVATPEPVLRRLCEFIGEEFETAMLEHHKHTNVAANLAWFAGAKQIHENSLRKWEKPEHQARLEEFMAHPEAVSLSQQLGYL
ncbi:MAG: sulfotransferase [Gammaproteobacteria bacterium]|jgi:hypothetical protein